MRKRNTTVVGHSTAEFQLTIKQTKDINTHFIDSIYKTPQGDLSVAKLWGPNSSGRNTECFCFWLFLILSLFYSSIYSWLNPQDIKTKQHFPSSSQSTIFRQEISRSTFAKKKNFKKWSSHTCFSWSRPVPAVLPSVRRLFVFPFSPRLVEAVEEEHCVRHPIVFSFFGTGWASSSLSVAPRRDSRLRVQNALNYKETSFQVRDSSLS